jgi:hypothetical protein
VNQGGCIERLAGRFSRQLLGRQQTQFAIDKREQLVRRLAISLFDRV